MASFARGRKGLRSFLLIHPQVEQRAAGGGLLVQKGKCGTIADLPETSGVPAQLPEHLHD